MKLFTYSVNPEHFTFAQKNSVPFLLPENIKNVTRSDSLVTSFFKVALIAPLYPNLQLAELWKTEKLLSDFCQVAGVLNDKCHYKRPRKLDNTQIPVGHCRLFFNAKAGTVYFHASILQLIKFIS